MSLSDNTYIRDLSSRLEKHPALSHASNICTKCSKRLSETEKKSIDALLPKYADYLCKQFSIVGYTDEIIRERVDLLNEYYHFYDEEQRFNSIFTSQGKMRSTILEEFMYILFKDYVEHLKLENNDVNGYLKSGATKAYTNLYFTASGISEFIKNPNVEINVKDQDFAIYRELTLNIEGKNKYIRVPIIAIENKTYVDKTMLEGIIATAEKLKSGNPYTWYGVVTECYDVDFSVDPIFSRIDQIYVLRKNKRKELTNNKIAHEVVVRMFKDVVAHIERPWSDIESKMRNEGVIL